MERPTKLDLLKAQKVLMLERIALFDEQIAELESVAETGE